MMGTFIAKSTMGTLTEKRTKAERNERRFLDDSRERHVDVCERLDGLSDVNFERDVDIGTLLRFRMECVAGHLSTTVLEGHRCLECNGDWRVCDGCFLEHYCFAAVSVGNVEILEWLLAESPMLDALFTNMIALNWLTVEAATYGHTACVFYLKSIGSDVAVAPIATLNSECALFYELVYTGCTQYPDVPCEPFTAKVVNGAIGSGDVDCMNHVFGLTRCSRSSDCDPLHASKAGTILSRRSQSSSTRRLT